MFVDRVDLADDAEGRVAIFSAAGAAPVPAAPPVDQPQRAGAVSRGGGGVTVVFDGPLAAVLFAAALVILLALGLLLTR